MKTSQLKLSYLRMDRSLLLDIFLWLAQHIIYAYVFKFMKIHISKSPDEQKRSDFSSLSLALDLICFIYYTCVSLLSLFSGWFYLYNVLQCYLLLPVSTASVLVQRRYYLTCTIVIASRLISLLLVSACSFPIYKLLLNEFAWSCCPQLEHL